MIKYFLPILTLPILLVSCATTDQQTKQPIAVRYGTPVQVSPSLKPSRRLAIQMNNTNPNEPGGKNQRLRETSTSLANAATSPLEVFNLRRPVAPLALQENYYIYNASPRPSCPTIAQELYVLNEAIGELDADDEAEEQQRIDKASNTAVDVVRSTSASLVPFSGVVRVASGAQAAKKKYDAHYDRGRRRRAFLKGYALGIGCNPPISPKVLVAPPPASDGNITNRANRKKTDAN